MRRLSALAGLVLLLLLAAALLWRVWRHHEANDPDQLDSPAVVRLLTRPPAEAALQQVPLVRWTGGVNRSKNFPGVALN
jgi:hypothetical protein